MGPCGVILAINGMKHKFRENLVGYLFISPWLIGFLVFTLYPFCQSFYLSLTRYNIIQEPKYIGFANYKMMLFQDELFWKSLWVTIRYALVSVPIVLVVGVLLALLLNINVKGMSIFRTIFYLPSIVPMVATTSIFMWILNPQEAQCLKIGSQSRLIQIFRHHPRTGSQAGLNIRLDRQTALHRFLRHQTRADHH